MLYLVYNIIAIMLFNLKKVKVSPHHMHTL